MYSSVSSTAEELTTIRLLHGVRGDSRVAPIGKHMFSLFLRRKHQSRWESLPKKKIAFPSRYENIQTPNRRREMTPKAFAAQFPVEDEFRTRALSIMILIVNGTTTLPAYPSRHNASQIDE